jgi:hypothetical protein
MYVFSVELIKARRVDSKTDEHADAWVLPCVAKAMDVMQRQTSSQLIDSGLAAG